MPDPVTLPVRIIFLDVDGTLTDGVIGFDGVGDSRHFWIRDGLALEWARDLGVLPVVISGRSSQAVAARMSDLSLEHYLGVKDKVAVAERVLRREGARWEECVMVGDDLPDVPMIRLTSRIPTHNFDDAYFSRMKQIGFSGFSVSFPALSGAWEQVLKRYDAL